MVAKKPVPIPTIPASATSQAPSQIAINNENKTCLVIKAKTIAKTGGRILVQWAPFACETNVSIAEGVDDARLSCATVPFMKKKHDRITRNAESHLYFNDIPNIE